MTAAAVAAPAFVALSRWHGAAVAGVRTAEAWTPAPATLFPWEPGREVEALAQLRVGTALVRFPAPDLDIVANVADTQMLWIVGEPSEVVAVGMPRLPVLSFALVHRDRHDPGESRRPLVSRVSDTGLTRIPALRA